MKLEFTTTACVRPELLNQTYKSLNDALVDVDLKTEGILYINIDPVPESSDEAIEEELSVARDHFSEVHYRVGETGGNFAKAVMWAFLQPNKEYFFNIEDDWLFDGEICIQDAISQIESSKIPNIIQCCCWESLEIEGKIWEAKGNRFMLPPSLFKNSTLKPLLKKHPVPATENPESYYRKLRDAQLVDFYNTIHIPKGAKYIDNGRQWSSQNGCSKANINGVMDTFTKWKFNKKT